MSYPYLKQLPALYVEDDQIIRFQASSVLEEHVGKLVLAEDGQEGLEKYTLEPFDMVMLDISMPGLDGVALSREIKSRNPKQRIVVMSSTDDARRLIELVNIGVDRFVPKPIDYDLLLDYLESVAAQYFQENRIREYQTLLEQKNDELLKTLTELQATQKQLVETEKMASLGGLVTGMAHEMNTPVGVCVTAASMMQEMISTLEHKVTGNTLKRSEMFDFFSTAQEQGDLLMRNLNRTAEMVTVFKRISTDEFLEPAGPIDFDEIFNAICYELDTASPAVGLKLVPDICMPPGFRSFRGALEEVVRQLAANAMAHAYRAGEGGEVLFRVAPEADRAVISVIDQGVGMAQPELDRIFLPFHKKEGSKGLGLGLNVAYNLAVHRLQGSLECISSPGSGTRFILTIPQVSS